MLTENAVEQHRAYSPETEITIVPEANKISLETVINLLVNKGIFTTEALRRWKKVPKWAQKKILANVFCSKCLGSVTILLEKAEMRGKDLILRGKCQNCGKVICRVVEPEEE